MRKGFEKIVSDEDVAAHRCGNFGPTMSARDVVDEGVLKYAFGYEGGSTQMTILLRHGLILKPLPGSYKSRLSKKGRTYLRAMFRDVRLDDILALRAKDSAR